MKWKTELSLWTGQDLKDRLYLLNSDEKIGFIQAKHTDSVTMQIHPKNTSPIYFDTTQPRIHYIVNIAALMRNTDTSYSVNTGKRYLQQLFAEAAHKGRRSGRSIEYYVKDINEHDELVQQRVKFVFHKQKKNNYGLRAYTNTLDKKYMNLLLNPHLISIENK